MFLTGARTRASTQRIVQVLARTLPRAEWRTVDGAGHMDFDSHPEEVDREIEAFLARNHGSWHRDPEPTAAFGLPVLAHRRGGLERTGAASR
ncbi:MAG: alpha/beta fold hydrolase [Gammaproteobacteria bacterium]